MIDFSNWPTGDTTEEESGRVVPYLDVEGEDDPIDYLFNLDGTHGLIARSNLHTLQGTKKAGKSAAGIALIVAALKGEFIGITPSQKDLAVLWVDTEQDKNTLRQKARAVLSMASLNVMPEHVKIVTLRGYGGPADALAATLLAIEENAADFVFLDGVVDLCESFNDEEKSRDVVRQLESLAEQRGAAILGLIHTNKYNDEARGHLGAIMQQKSAEIYQVNKEGNTAKVTQPFSRFAPVPAFSFTFADDFKIMPPAGGNKETELFSDLYNKFTPLFSDNDWKTRKELANLYQEYYGVSKRTAESEITAAYNSHALAKEVKGKNVYYSLPLNNIDAEEDDL